MHLTRKKPLLRIKRRFKTIYEEKKSNFYVKLWTYANYDIDYKFEKKYEMMGRHLMCEVLSVKRQHHNFALGHSFCNECMVYMSIPDRKCPCCTHMLRRKAKDKTQSGMERMLREVKEH